MTEPRSYTPAEIATLEAALSYAEQWLEHRAWATRTPGVQAAIAFDGGLKWAGAFGVADISTGVELTNDHLFRIASHSKTFTATAIFQLVEAGALTLHDAAELHVPELAGSPLASVTVRELLGHSAGIIRDGLDGDYWQHIGAFPDEDAIVRILIDEGKVFEPNDRFKYTNIGYSLLGLIVGAASGIGYNAYVAAEICDRLGLTNTGPELDESRASEYAAAHTGLHTSRERTTIPHVDTRAMASATGFYSTATDLVAYFGAHAMGDERLLSNSSKRLQQRQEWQTDPTSTKEGYYGLGMISEKVGDRAIIGHSGGYPGHITRSLVDPATGLAVSVLTNSIDGPASDLALGVLQLLDYALEKPVDSVDAAKFTGRFASMWGVMDIAQLGDRIVAIHPGAISPVAAVDTLVIAGTNSLRFESGSGYGSIGEDVFYEFDESGKVLSIKGGGGMTMWPIETYRAMEAGRE